MAGPLPPRTKRKTTTTDGQNASLQLNAFFKKGIVSEDIGVRCARLQVPSLLEAELRAVMRDDWC